MPPAVAFGPTHTFLRGLAAYAFASFWHRVLVLVADDDTDNGDSLEDRVPREGTPCIVVANHWNSAADVAVLSCYFPHYRKLHYWAKSTLFAPGLPRKILLDAGNIPVDRKTKDNQKLFAATFDALKAGEAIVVFPEGGSETVHTLPPLKDGASWAALEYAKNIRDPVQARVFSDGSPCTHDVRDVVLSVAGIAYTDKSKYRGCATMEFGPNIDITPYVDEFLEHPKSAVKKLTARIHAELTKVTVNAPDWDSRHAAMMARKILWPDDRKLPLRNLRKIDQALVDLFAAPEPSRALRRLRRLLTMYRDELNATGLSHLSLSALPLPATLDPDVPHPLPTRFRVIGSVLLSTLACLARLPFFALPLVVHLPVYLFARYASSGALEEDKAQNKVAIGLVLALATYAAFFAVACALLWTSVAWGGAIVIALVGTVAFVAYHNRLVDANYRQFQRLIALWTVLFALWTPVARDEADHFLHRVHPALSLSPHPGIRLGNSSDLPYDDDGDGDDDRRALLYSAAAGGQGGEGEGAGDDGEDAAEDDDDDDDDDQYRRRPAREPLPSPVLFSEQDRLLGGPARQAQPNRVRDRNRDGERDGERDCAETTIEMPPLGSGIVPAESTCSSRAPSLSPRRDRDRARDRDRDRAGGRGPRAQALRVRQLLRLRVEVVQALGEALFPPGTDAVDDDDQDDDDDAEGVRALEAVHIDVDVPVSGASSAAEPAPAPAPWPASGSSASASASASASVSVGTTTRRRSLSSSSPAPPAAPWPRPRPPLDGWGEALGEGEGEGEREGEMTASAARARAVGVRMRALGWRGSGLGLGRGGGAARLGAGAAAAAVVRPARGR
ncbi:hypothetical protein JCM3770_001517 [Rhodotorula araucariae]